MVAHESGVHGGEERLLAVPGVAGLEAEPRLGLALRVLRRQGEQLAAAVELLRRVESAAVELAQLAHLAQVGPVDVGGVGEGGDLVHLLAKSQGQLSWHRPKIVDMSLHFPGFDKR